MELRTRNATKELKILSRAPILLRVSSNPTATKVKNQKTKNIREDWQMMESEELFL